jgi:hypothetical protein
LKNTRRIKRYCAGKKIKPEKVIMIRVPGMDDAGK